MDSRRDEYGRVGRLPDLIGFVAAGLVTGVVVMVVLDGGFALLKSDGFGRLNGWLALILPAWLFVEEFRAWRRAPVSSSPVMLTAVVAAAIALAAGLSGITAISAVVAAPPLVTGSIGALVSAVGYALVWFYGVRWATGSRFADR